MQWSYLVLILAFATGSQGIVLVRGRAESLEVLEVNQTSKVKATSGEWAALEAAEAADRCFLLAQLDATESELVHIQQVVQGKTKELAGLQLAVAPEAAAAKVAVKKTPETKNVAVVNAAKKEDMTNLLGMPKMPDVKGLMGKAALAPMLFTLKNLYEASKVRIAEQSGREDESQKWFTEKAAKHKAKLSNIEHEFANDTLDEELRKHETREENDYFTYWQSCLDRQQHHFHTNLKIQHAMMSKVKAMIDMYEKALSSKPEDQKAAKKQIGQMTGVPGNVFLQSALSSFCHDSLEDVHKERAELQTVVHQEQAGYETLISMITKQLDHTLDHTSAL